ncbi:hypothetical protein Droror1_Dr00022955 [Drosera rotundifolia]
MRPSASKYLIASKRALTLFDRSNQCLSISHLKQIQARLTVSATLSDPFAAAKLISSFAASAATRHAYKLFIRSPRRTLYMWNTIIRTLTETNNEPVEAIYLYKEMLAHGLLPNNYTFSFIIRACVNLCDLWMGRLVHAQVVKLGWEDYDFVLNGFIHLYAVCGAMDDSTKLLGRDVNRDVVAWTAVINGYLKSGRVAEARELFDEMPERNAVTWGAMVAGYAQMGYFREALELFNEMIMMRGGIRPQHACIVGALTACAALGALDQGRWLHGYVDKNKMELDMKLGTSLVDMYAKCGCIEMALCVFEEIPCKDVFHYTSLISGLSNHGMSAGAIQLFRRMELEGVCPNEVTFISVLSACSRMGFVDDGLQIFRSMKSKYGIQPGVEHYGCMMNLLGTAGLLEEAEKIMRSMPMKPDAHVLGALLNACRVHGDVELGKEMIQQLMEQGLDHGGSHTGLSNLLASSNQWDEVERTRKEMEEKKVRKLPGCSSIEVDDEVHVFVSGRKVQMLIEDVLPPLLTMVSR